jgi:hypothetical protein
LAISRKAPTRLVQRARVNASLLEEPTLYASEAGLKAGVTSSAKGAEWAGGFNEPGKKGLEVRPAREKANHFEDQKCAIALIRSRAA